MSFDSGASPSVSLRALAQSDRNGHAYGWGFAWYPEQSSSALLVKDPTSLGENAMTKLLREWDRFHSTLFVCHLRGAARALQEQDTHPFKRAYGRREWILAHNGDLEGPDGDLGAALPLGDDPAFEPVGRTDSEHAFCWLLMNMRKLGARSLADVGFETLHGWFKTLDGLGTANFLLADGRDLAVYSDDTAYNRLHVARLVPPNVPPMLRTDDLEVDLDDARDRARTVVVFSTVPLTDRATSPPSNAPSARSPTPAPRPSSRSSAHETSSEGSTWRPMSPGQLIVVRRGAFVFDSEATADTRRLMVVPLPAGRTRTGASATRSPSEEPGTFAQAGLQHAATPADLDAGAPTMTEPPVVAPPSEPPVDTPTTSGALASEKTEVEDASRTAGGEPVPAKGASVRVHVPYLPHQASVDGAGRLLRVMHETTYLYEKPVEKSFHLFRLQPVHDRWQDLLEFDLEISVEGVRRPYDDVFGNAALRVEVERPYSELRVFARSLVRVRHEPPDDLHSPHRRFSIPLVWMPWQRQMMSPYLLPPELPETELGELSEFAMSFVERQDYDLVQTLIDMNITIYRDFAYRSGSTTMATTPFQVFCRRTGVCQDFANLFICLARLLGVPARYRVGYIFTGASYENRLQSEASHAWAELYLPWSGWQGFDPTNGCLVGKDHIRVAAGRNYGDATPTSGTIYKGGGMESLTVVVRVEDAFPIDGP